MTNEEVIKIINNMPNYKPWEVEALALAIKALEQQNKSEILTSPDPCNGCRYELNSTNGNPCYSCGKYKLTEQEPCEDYTSEEEVTDIILSIARNLERICEVIRNDINRADNEAPNLQDV